MILLVTKPFRIKIRNFVSDTKVVEFVVNPLGPFKPSTCVLRECIVLRVDGFLCKESGILVLRPKSKIVN